MSDGRAIAPKFLGGSATNSDYPALMALRDQEPITPRRRADSSQRIMHAIARAIRARDFIPGERLVEQHLAERFGVSRGPVREALRMLASYGMVRIDPNRGAIVPKLSDADVEAASEITGLLLAYAAKRAARNGAAGPSQTFKAAIETLVARMAIEGSTAETYFDALTPDVNALLEAAASPLLANTFRNLSLLGPAAAYARLGIATRKQRARRVRQWLALAEAVSAGDERRAEREALQIQQASLAAARETLE